MAKLSHTPHIRNVEAGNKYYDPMHASIFEVAFSIPQAIASKFNGKDVAILSEQVTTVSGLDALQKTASAGEQKFLGVSASYLNPMLDNTYADLTVELNLNIRNATDAYVFRIFKEWEKLGYDLSTGIRYLMKDYVAPFLTIKEANRDGTVWREVKFQKVMLTGVTGLDALDYTNNEARKLTCTFRTDLWDETINKGIAGK
jgi:hypothetical protein